VLEVAMNQETRISPEEARRRMTEAGALLVCAYENEEKCRKIALEGAIPLNRFRERLPALSVEQEIIFFCA